MKKEKGLVRFGEKFGFLTFSMSNNIVFNFKSLYYLTFLKMILQIPVFWATTIVTIGTIWDAINDPLIGAWSVNYTFKSGEKIRPITIYFAIPWAITVVLLFVDFGFSQTWTIITAILVYLVFEAFYTFLCIPYNSLATLSSNVDVDRRSINAFRSLGACFGSGIGAVTVPLIVKNVFHGLQSDIYTKDDALALLYTAIVMAVISVTGCFVHYFTSKERIKPQVEHEEHISILDSFKMLFSVKSWVVNMIYILFYGIITALIMNEINDYAAYILGDSEMATPILAVYLVFSILTSAFIDPIDQFLGRRGCMIFAAAIQVVGKIPFIINPYSMATIYINAITTAIGASAAFVMFNTNRNNVSDIVEFKFGRRIDSMVATCDNLITKLAEAVAVWLMGIALSGCGYDATLGVNQPEMSKACICALLGWVPAILSIGMTYFAYKTHIVEEYKEEQEKNAQTV